MRQLFLNTGTGLYHKKLMICLSLHKIGIILDHKVASDIPLRETNTTKQALSFLGPKIWTKISYSIKNVKTTASFIHRLKREILSKLSRKTI